MSTAPPTRSGLELVRWWGKVAKPPPRVAAAFFAACSVAGLSQAAFAGLLGGVLRSATSVPTTVVSSAGTARVIFSLVALALTRALSGLAASTLRARLTGQALLKGRDALVEAHFAAHKVPQTGQRDHTPSELAAALGPGIERQVVTFGDALLEGSKGGLELAAMAILAFVVSIPTGLGFVLILAVFLGLLARREARARSAKDDRAKLEGTLAALLSDATRRADLLVAYGRDDRARREILDASGKIEARREHEIVRRARSSAANEVLGALFVGVLLVASKSFGKESIDTSRLPLALFVFLSYRPLRALAELLYVLRDHTLGPNSLPFRLDTLAAGRDAHGPPRDEHRRGPLVLDALRLGHGTSSPLTCEIPDGSFVAIVGPNGSGKTTLLRTLLGLEAPLSGCTRYDGMRLVGEPAGRPIAWMPADAELLHASLEENASGLDGPLLGPLGSAKGALGEDGRAVSRGERQWIAFLRAERRNAPVLLLDEPTTGLDAERRTRLLSELERLAGTRTVLVVTHDLDLAARADLVMKLPEGTVTLGLRASERSPTSSRSRIEGAA